MDFLIIIMILDIFVSFILIVVLLGFHPIMLVFRIGLSQCYVFLIKVTIFFMIHNTEFHYASNISSNQ